MTYSILNTVLLRQLVMNLQKLLPAILERFTLAVLKRQREKERKRRCINYYSPGAVCEFYRAIYFAFQ